MLIANPLGALVGGIGLFLLGMWLMTDGLRLAAGAALPWLPGMPAREHPTITVAMQSGSAADVSRHMEKESLSFLVLNDPAGQLHRRCTRARPLRRNRRQDGPRPAPALVVGGARSFAMPPRRRP